MPALIEPLLRPHAMWLLALLGGLLATSGAAWADGAHDDPCRSLMKPRPDQLLVHVPFETVDGRIYVQAQVNGRPGFRFAVDTGASGLARADTRLKTALGLKAEGTSGNSDGVQTAQADTVSIDSIVLDGLRRDGIEAITRDYRAKLSEQASFDGILARGFFADGLLVIDYPGKTLSFSRALSLTRDQPGVLPYTRAFRVPVRIGDQQVEGNLDTGANVALVLPKSLYERVATGPLSEAGPGQLSNASIATEKATVHGPLRVGALVLSDLDARVSDRFPELLVGALALKESVLMIDQRSERVAVCNP
jgi:predicted aspartyl protease